MRGAPLTVEPHPGVARADGSPEGLRYKLRVTHAGGALDNAVAAVVADILQCAPGAVAATKALIAKARFHSPASLVQHAAEVFSAAALGDEGLEGTSAFLHKRKASWVPQ